jgi:replication factor C small subunit
MDHAIWTEKYRPHAFNDIKGQELAVQKVEAFLEKKNMPHLLFAGPAGVGKTTLALAIATKLYGKEWQQNFLELNASDERGIDVVRNKVKDFARTRSMGDVPFKIIYLDECDALTREAQQALRRTMENYTATTRFILSCNYSSKIIDPIQSRCTIFRFQQLDKKALERIVDHIAKTEKLKLADKAMDALFEVAEGDARRAVNILQACASMGEKISEDDIFQMASIAKPKEIKAILEDTVKQKFLEAKNKLLSVMLNYGLSGLDVIKQIQKEVWGLDIPPEKRLAITKMCGEAEFRMVEGSDEFVQLEALLAAIALV